jgi:regulator of sirC expression with transglutaminase-like and TPR domain
MLTTTKLAKEKKEILKINKKEVASLIKLLDDDDRGIVRHVTTRLIEMGEKVVPLLEKQCWQSDNTPLLEERLEMIIHKINFNNIYSSFEKWVTKDNPDLLEALIILSKFHQPDLKETWIHNKITRIYDDIYCKLGIRQSPLKSVSVFNQVFYDLYEFESETGSNDSQNFMLNRVLFQRKGDPTLLSILYLILAKQLKLPVFAVHLPHDLILARTKRHIANPNNKNTIDAIEFYIHPGDKGAIFTKLEIETYLQKQQHVNNYLFSPCCNITIIRILIENLKEVFINNKQTLYANEMQKVIDILICR